MSAIEDVVALVTRQKRFGFRLDEIMKGGHEFEPEFGPPGRHKMAFKVTWGTRDVASWANPLGRSFMTNTLDGVVTIGGLCTDAPCKGQLELRYFTDHRIRYSFELEVDGKPYRYVGQKVNIRLWTLPVSVITCFGTLTEADTGRLVSRSVTYFNMKAWAIFAASFRPVLSAAASS